MSTIFRIILGAVIAAASIGSPAFAQYASQKGHLATVRHSGHVRTASHRSALSSFASLPRSVDDPAMTGGGSIGYNESLRLNRW
jgi:hypothetical protein